MLANKSNQVRKAISYTLGNKAPGSHHMHVHNKLIYINQQMIPGPLSGF